MAGNKDQVAKFNIQLLVDQILLDGQVSRQDYLLLTTTFLSDYSTSEEERRQINRVFDNLQTNQLKFSD
jgi:hypothetical protein